MFGFLTSRVIVTVLLGLALIGGPGASLNGSCNSTGTTNLCG